MAEDYDSDLERFMQETITSDVESLAAIDSCLSSPDVSMDRRHKQQSGDVGRHWWDDGEETGERRSFLKPVGEKELEDTAGLKISATLQSTTGKSDFSVDSLDAAQPVDDPAAHQSDDFNDTFSASSHVQSPLIQSKPSNQLSQSGVSVQQGLDTMEEMADKERFFAQLEEGRSSPVDYGKLNEDFNVTTGTLKELEEQLRKKDSDEVASEASSKKSSSSSSSKSSSSSNSSSSSSSRRSSLSHEANGKDSSHNSSKSGNRQTSGNEKETEHDSDQREASRERSSEAPDVAHSLWQTTSKLAQMESTSSRDKFTKVVLDAMQHTTSSTEDIMDVQTEKRGFELSPIRASKSPSHASQHKTEVINSVEIRRVKSNDSIESREDDEHSGGKEDDGGVIGNDSQQIAMEELQAALKAAGLPAIGGKHDDEHDGYIDTSSGLIVEGAGGDVPEKISESGSLLTLAQVHNVSSNVLALGAAHSQKRDYQTQIKRDEETVELPMSPLRVDHIDSNKRMPQIDSNEKSRLKERFDYSPLDTTRDDPRGFDLSPALPYSPQPSPSVAHKVVADAEIEAIVADVKKVETELQHVVNSTKKKIQTKKPIAARFTNVAPRVSQVPAKSKVVKKKEEPGYLKSTASTDMRYGWKAGESVKTPAGHTTTLPASHTLRQTQALKGIQLGGLGESDVGERGSLVDVGGSVGNVDAVQLAASVDSFASYLHQFVEHVPQVAGSVTTRTWTSTSDKIHSHDSSITKPFTASGEKHVDVEDIKHCQQCDRLQSEAVEREKHWRERAAESKQQYEEETRKLQQEVFILQAKLRAVEQESQSKQSVEGDHQLELERLERELKEQEGLIQGYQLENERLYKEVKDQQTKMKAVESHLFAENQRQAAELVSVRSKLERREQELLGVGAITGRQPTEGSAALGAARIHELEHQLQDAKQMEEQLRDKLTESKEVNRMLEESLSALKLEMATTSDHLNQELSQQKTIADASVQLVEQRIESMRVSHEKEVAAMKRQLRWYVENQEMLDKDAEKMKKYETEMERMRDELQAVKFEGREVSNRTKRRDKERQADARRIQDLERQVREMDQVIRRRHPNSLPALIYAANVSSTTPSTTSQHQTLSSPSPKHSTVFLEHKLHKLERQLLTNDEEWERKMRSIQQKHNALQLRYEERISGLTDELEGHKIASRTPGNTHPHTTVQALEKELRNVQLTNHARLEQLESENKTLKTQLKQEKSHDEKPVVRRKARRRLVVDTKAKGNDIVDEGANAADELDSLSDVLRQTREEVEVMREAYAKLEVERNQLLVEVGRREGVRRDGSSDHEERGYDPRAFGDEARRLGEENQRMKEQVSHLQLELEHQRVQQNAHAAEAAARMREAREAAEEKFEAETSRLRKQLDAARAESLLTVSDSETARLKSKISAQEVMIRHLQEQLAASPSSTEILAAARVREEKLKQQVERLHKELTEAQEHHTPEMRHYEVLASKIRNMEQKHFQREQELRNIIFRTQQTAGVEMDQTNAYWKQELELKNQQVERFREELDIILNVLQQLKRQGIAIPM